MLNKDKFDHNKTHANLGNIGLINKFKIKKKSLTSKIQKVISSFNKPKRKQTCSCYCPSCNNELISTNSYVSEDNGLVKYICSKCDKLSYFHFDIAPVPIYMGKTN